MVDTRFHASSGPVPLGKLLASLATSIELTGEGADRVIEGADELTTAGPTEIALAAHQRYVEALRDTSAGVVVAPPELRAAIPDTAIAVIVERPHDVFADLLDRLYPADTLNAIGGLADDDAPVLEPGVRLGPNVVIGPRVEIGRNTVIGANTVIGPGVTIGRNSIVGNNCSIDCAHLGNDVVIHAGVRVGCEGFGWLDHGRSNRKIPQLGRVIIQDKVEIGANSTIDRGALGDTVIGEGTKVDNLVQIGHNCRIGRYCLIAGQSGLSGSTILEDSVRMGGGAGTAGHLTIGAGALIRGRSAVIGNVAAGSDMAGTPAQSSVEHARELGVLRRLARRKDQ